jgi:hypothetical protein
MEKNSLKDGGKLGLCMVIVCLVLVFASFLILEGMYTLYFETMDKTCIQKSGTNEINFIVNESNHNGNESQRLNKIADLITRNYEDKITDPIYPPLLGSNHYTYSEEGRIRVVPFEGEINPYVQSVTHKLQFDPNWLIYQKLGACRELSVIFYHVTNKASFSSRIVRTGDGQDEYGRHATHWWNEVEVNGVNKTFDVQWYLQIKNNIKSDGSTWSGNRSDFIDNSNSFSPEQLCNWRGVWIADTDGRQIEDVTSDYMGEYNCPWVIKRNQASP